MSSRKALFLTAISGLLAFPASAVSPRVFMSPGGNDSADCANALTPCATFAGALAQVNVGGEVIALATGGYGTLNISKAVTVSGPNGVVLYSHLAVTINAPSAKVVIRGMTVDGATGDGISVIAATNVFIENCVINATTGNGISVASGVATDLVVQDSTVRNNALNGILVPSAGGGLTVNNCHIEGNAGDGVHLQGGKNAIRHSTIEKNTGDGVDVETSGTFVSVERSLLARNGGNGLIVTSSATARLSDSTVTANPTGLFNSGGTLTTRGNNTVIDNTANTSGTITTYPPV